MTVTIQPFDLSVNLEQALLWQYDQADRLKSLISDKQAWYNQNQSQFWDDWKRNVFDLKTANDFGLSVWAIILGQPIVFPNVGNPDKENFGFGEYHLNFTRGNFASTSGFTYRLSMETARVLLRMRYYQLIGTCTVPSINRMLADVFADYGSAYVLDGLDMTQTYIFGFNLPSDMKFIFENTDILPRPSGVGTSYSVIISEAWGVGEYRENFDNGNFSEG